MSRDFYEDYYVNEEKKIVVCKISDCSGALICDMCHKGWPPTDEMIINDSFVGKAKCSSEDTFDVERGKRIARIRAYAKLARAKQKKLAAFMDRNNKSMEALARDTKKLIERYQHVEENAVKHVENIVNVSE